MTAPRQIEVARLRYKRCQDISACARFIGLDVTPYKVNCALQIWERWYQGRLTLDLLIRITGIKRISRDEVKVSHDTHNG